MINCILKVKEITPGTIACYTEPNDDNSSQLERDYFGILDVALRAAMEFTLEKMKLGEIIEGKHIDGYVKAACSRVIKSKGLY